MLPEALLRPGGVVLHRFPGTDQSVSGAENGPVPGGFGAVDGDGEGRHEDSRS